LQGLAAQNKRNCRIGVECGSNKKKGEYKMANNKLETTFAAVNGGQDSAILTGKSPIYPYEGGKRISETPTGTKVDVALQGNRFTPLTVKIEGNTNILPNCSNEQINTACASVKLIAVRFVDCKISLYSIGGQMVMSATASGVELVNFGK
jgi:hypothetical protein